MNTIQQYIIDGYKKGYYDNLHMNTGGGEFQSEAAEYVFTVNIAQNLLEWRRNSDEGLYYSIVFELSASLFKNYCFLEWRLRKPDDIFDGRVIRRKKHKPIRNETGRIDVAVLSPEKMFRDRRSKVGIELKGINPSKTAVKKDVERLVDCLIAEDPISENSLQFCFVIFGHRLDMPKKVFNQSDYKSRLEKYRGEVENNLSKITCLVNVDYSFHLFDIDKTTGEDFIKYNRDEDGLVDYHEAVEGTGAIVGVSITLKPKFHAAK